MASSPPAKSFRFFKGRIALHAILKAAGIEPGDQVLLPGYTCVVVPNAIRYLGAEPVFLDIDPRTFNLDPEAVRAWLESPLNSSARILIVQHTYGIPCDMDALIDLSQKFGLLVVEDSCHAIGSKFKGRPVGTMGAAAFFSSQWSKPVTTGLGGWATVNDPTLVSRMESILGEYNAPGRLETLALDFQFGAYSLAFRPRLFWILQSLYRRLGDLGLAIGSSTGLELTGEEPGDYMKTMGHLQERRLEKLLANMSQVISLRKCQQDQVEKLLTAEGLPRLELSPSFDPVILRYPLPIGNKNEILALARQKRIQLGDWFVSPVHPNVDRWGKVGYVQGSCPVAERACSTTVNIPIGPQIREDEIERTVRFLGLHARPAAS